MKQRWTYDSEWRTRYDAIRGARQLRKEFRNTVSVRIVRGKTGYRLYVTQLDARLIRGNR